MATTDATGFPTKNQAYRQYFYIHDNMGAAVTAAWTGITGGCQVIVDGVLSTARDIVQVATTNCGYVDIPLAQMNSNATCLRCAISNANAMAFECVVNPVDLSNVTPADPRTLRLSDLITQDWNYIFGRDTNDGSNIKMYGLDKTTQVANMALTGQIEKGAAY